MNPRLTIRQNSVKIFSDWLSEIVPPVFCIFKINVLVLDEKGKHFHKYGAALISKPVSGKSVYESNVQKFFICLFVFLKNVKRSYL